MLVVSVAFASLLGSMHCVGMCGPLTTLCIQPGQNGRTCESILAYHLGRLASYSLLGAIAGFLGATVQATSGLLGVQRSMASIAGIVLATIGLLGLMRLGSGQSLSFHPPQWSVHLVAPAIRWLRHGITWKRSMTLGLLTALLPCGWLYVFLLTSAASASIASGALIMAVFSLGSVPLLSVAMIGSSWFGNRYRSLWPVVSAVLLIIVGMVTALHRSTIDLTPLHKVHARVHAISTDESILAQELKSHITADLPCCQPPNPAANVPMLKSPSQNESIKQKEAFMSGRQSQGAEADCAYKQVLP